MFKYKNKITVISNLKCFLKHLLVSSNCFYFRKANFVQIEINKNYPKPTTTQGKS